MKTILIKKAVLMLCIFTTLLSCEKNNAFTENNNPFDASSLKTTDTKCKGCETEGKTYDLVDQLKTFPLKEGNNSVATLENGTKLIAVVKKGTISTWYMQDNTGKTYYPSSNTNTQKKASRLGQRYDIYKVCMILDGRSFCWFVFYFNVLNH